MTEQPLTSMIENPLAGLSAQFDIGFGILPLTCIMVLVLVSMTRTYGNTVFILIFANVVSYVVFNNEGVLAYLLPVSIVIIGIKTITEFDIMYKISKLYKKSSGKITYGENTKTMSVSTKILLVLGLLKIKKTP